MREATAASAMLPPSLLLIYTLRCHACMCAHENTYHEVL